MVNALTSTFSLISLNYCKLKWFCEILYYCNWVLMYILNLMYPCMQIIRNWQYCRWKAVHRCNDCGVCSPRECINYFLFIGNESFKTVSVLTNQNKVCSRLFNMVLDIHLVDIMRILIESDYSKKNSAAS